MKQTFRTYLNKLSPQLRSKTLEHQYGKACSERLLEKFWMCLMALIISQTALALIVMENRTTALIVIQSCIALLTLLLFLLKKKAQKFIKLPILVIACLINIAGSLHFSNQALSFSHGSLFLYVSVITSSQYVLGVLLFRFEFIIALQVFSIISRAYIICNVDPSAYRDQPLAVLASILIDVIYLLLAYTRELDDRTLFTKTFSEENMYSQFMEKLLPQSLLILDENLTTELFVNNSFQNMLHQNTTTKNSKEVLRTFSIEREDVQKDISSLFERNPSLSLYDLLVRAKKTRKLTKEPFTFLASCNSRVSSQRLFEIKVFQLKWETANAIALIFNDIEATKGIISQKTSNAGKDKLISTISHELKTPIHGILTMLTIGQDTVQAPEALSIFSFCKKNSLLLLSLINSILDLQLVRSNKIKLHPSKVHLETLVKEVISLFDIHCSQKHLKLDYEIDKGVPAFLSTDQERLSQVLVNIVGNAIKFTYKGGITIRIKPSVSEEGDSIETTTFEIEDTGLGITECKQAKLFKMFEDSDVEESKEHGAGLGLTISNYLVSLLGRQDQKEGIKCTSKSNEGTVFSFSIFNQLEQQEKLHRKFSDFFKEEIEDSDIEMRLSPYQNKKPDPSKTFDNSKTSISGFCDLEEGFFNNGSTRKLISPRSDSLAPLANSAVLERAFTRRKKGREISLVVTPPMLGEMKFKGKGKKPLSGWVLLVDDNPLNLLVGKKIIEDTGCQVKTAINGEDAISKVQEHAKSRDEFFKLILMDCQMPVMDGYDATKALRELIAQKLVPECKIVALTANDSDEDIIKCKKCGMDDVLSKPLKDQKLHQILQGL